ncbi:MAG: ABC transporter substrate-binding protein ArtJ [Phototrophicaceae bacterium]
MITLLLLAFSGYVYGVAMLEWRDNLPPSLEDAFPSGTIIVGVDATYPPFAVDNGQELYGIDIDLGNALAEQMEMPIRFVNMGFDGLYDALIDGQVDIVISALLVNSARTNDVRYTQPYFDNGLVLVSDNPDLQTVDDLASRSVALEYGSIAHSQANFWEQRLDPFMIMPYELPNYALDALRLDDSDFALVDTTSYWLYRGQNPDWQSQSERVNNAFYAIATRYDREATWVWVNVELGRLKRDGVVQDIIDEWFETP